MKKKKQRLLIPFSSLKDGKHEFEFSINAEFFEQFDHSLVNDGNVEIEIDFENKPNLLELSIRFDGNINTTCDRCSDPLEIPIEGDEFLVVKFGDDESIDDHIMYIPDNAYELDISDQIYQMVNLSLPVKVEHINEEDCDPEMIQKLREFSGLSQKEKEDQLDPRWDALNKLKNN
jgi:uncharacterized metal-binding protein YceD (DUF177 family)